MPRRKWSVNNCIPAPTHHTFTYIYHSAIVPINVWNLMSLNVGESDKWKSHTSGTKNRRNPWKHSSGEQFTKFGFRFIAEKLAVYHGSQLNRPTLPPKKRGKKLQYCCCSKVKEKDRAASKQSLPSCRARLNGSTSRAGNTLMKLCLLSTQRS